VDLAALTLCAELPVRLTAGTESGLLPEWRIDPASHENRGDINQNSN
jgi:hypothetical protein